MWSNRNSHTLLLGMQNITATLEDSLTVSYKTKYTLTIWSRNCAPLYLPKGTENYIHTKTCIWVFIATLFIIAKFWKQPRCPLVGGWINKLWYIQTMEYYSMLKTNELSSHEITWRKLQCTLLVKEANLRRLHTVWLQLNEFLEKIKLWIQ